MDHLNCGGTTRFSHTTVSKTENFDFKAIYLVRSLGGVKEQCSLSQCVYGQKQHLTRF
jgi:hypothetical protein